VTEAALTNKIRLKLKAQGHFIWKSRGDPRQTKGIPDLCGCRAPDGTFFGLEVKLPGKEKKLTKNQAETLNRIAIAGGIAVVVTSVSQALEALSVESE
jgi:hypothetical protein